MALPLVMPANNIQTAEELNIRFPGRLGVLLTPDGWKGEGPRTVPFVLDNGRYAVWSSGKEWSSKNFRTYLDRASEIGYAPEWLVVPDVVGNALATLEEWEKWTPRLDSYGWRLALAVQDGMTVDMAAKLDRAPDVIFVGGTTEWKWRYAREWCSSFGRVHIGRVSTKRRLWMAQDCGAESSDSNVWRPIGRHIQELCDYLKKSNDGLDNYETGGFGIQ